MNFRADQQGSHGSAVNEDWDSRLGDEIAKIRCTARSAAEELKEKAARELSEEASSVRESASVEAECILRAARDEAEEIRHQARRSADEVTARAQAEVERLQNAEARLRFDLENIVRCAGDLLGKSTEPGLASAD